MYRTLSLSSSPLDYARPYVRFFDDSNRAAVERTPRCVDATQHQSESCLNSVYRTGDKRKFFDAQDYSATKKLRMAFEKPELGENDLRSGANLVNRHAKESHYKGKPYSQVGQVARQAKRKSYAQNEKKSYLEKLAVSANVCAKELNNLINRATCLGIARRVWEWSGFKEEAQKSELKHLSMLANAFSKFSEDIGCEKASAAIAREVFWRIISDPKEFNAQDLAAFANAFSKFPKNADCEKACVEIAFTVSTWIREKKEAQLFNAQELSNLAKAFSEFPHNEACQEVGEELAWEVCEWMRTEEKAQNFTEQGLVNLVKAFYELMVVRNADSLEAYTYELACELLAGEVSRRMQSEKEARNFSEQELTSLVKAFDKFVVARNVDGLAANAIEMLASEVAWRMSNSQYAEKFERGQLLSLGSVFRKFIGSKTCYHARKAIARYEMF